MGLFSCHHCFWQGVQFGQRAEKGGLQMAESLRVQPSVNGTTDKKDTVMLTGAPPNEFWANELEFDSARAERALAEDGVLTDWIDRLSGRRARMLCVLHDLPHEGSVGKLRPLLHARATELAPLYLVSEFGKGKSEVATVEVARDALAPHLVDLCVRPRRKPPEPGEPDDDRYDKMALLFALYVRDPDLLREVLHFDKVHKKGFASMVLAPAQPRPPKRALGAFLTDEALGGILESLQRARRDGSVSELQGIWEREGRLFVFIRRTERPDHIHDGRHIVHGYRAEWIVLDFAPDGGQVNIASTSIDESREIADLVARAYFECDCRFVNEEKVTEAATIHTFIAAARAGHNGVALVEACTSNSALRGSSKVRLSNEDPRAFCESLDHLEQSVGPLLESLSDVDSIKVLYRRKRVGLQFDQDGAAESQFVVRYTDQRLNAFERRWFEQTMRDEHGITILSTEKR